MPGPAPRHLAHLLSTGACFALVALALVLPLVAGGGGSLFIVVPLVGTEAG